MMYAETDLAPNRPIQLAQVVVGCTSDARWRAITVTDRVDAALAHELERSRFERVRFGSFA